mmetsp:Transcript_22261/g.69096  ORF Transcript_22261/g.69096 Transcript_22261/m.69096 type:complete len:282 (+) Transcript_22261:628-1473(+)
MVGRGGPLKVGDEHVEAGGGVGRQERFRAGAGGRLQRANTGDYGVVRVGKAAHRVCGGGEEEGEGRAASRTDGDGVWHCGARDAHASERPRRASDPHRGYCGLRWLHDTLGVHLLQGWMRGGRQFAQQRHEHAARRRRRAVHRVGHGSRVDVVRPRDSDSVKRWQARAARSVARWRGDGRPCEVANAAGKVGGEVLGDDADARERGGDDAAEDVSTLEPRRVQVGAGVRRARREVVRDRPEEAEREGVTGGHRVPADDAREPLALVQHGALPAGGVASCNG